MKEIQEDYIPFGEEWEKEISRLPKNRIIKFLRDALMKNIILEKVINKVEDVEIQHTYKKSFEN